MDRRILLIALIPLGCGARTPLNDLESRGAAATEEPPAFVREIALGETHACLTRNSGEPYCWGSNSHGQLGDDSLVDRALPVRVAGLSSVLELAAGRLHTCARLGDGTLRCWGSRAVGQLGDGISLIGTTLFVVRTPAPVANVRGALSLAAGDSFTCALTTGGTLCFGSNDFGELGDGRTVRSSSASNVLDLDGPTQLAAGAAHACALMGDGLVRCWGSNEDGQLGGVPGERCGTQDCSRRAIPATVASDVAQLDVAANRTCAVSLDGGVYCWGALVSGVAFAAERVPVLEDVVEVALGKSHNCARRSDGSVWCWGSADRGQLGVPVSTPCPKGPGVCSVNPVRVTSLPRAKRIALGGDSSCAIVEDGSVRCWGRNDKGQLGDGTTIDRAFPVRVALPE